jgi:hypothetical protein
MIVPFDPDEPWICHDAIDACNTVVGTLDDAGVLESGPRPDTVTSAIVVRCQPCRSGRGTPRTCTGWQLGLRPHVRLRGRVSDRDVVVLLEGWQDHRHAPRAAAGQDVLNAGSMSMTVMDPGGEILTRQHTDVANQGQAGPVGHLQLGGLPSFGPRPDLEWLDQPRWPMPAMDIVLLAELALYSFAPESWTRLRENTRWRQQIQRSESLAYGLWLGNMNNYWSQRGARSTWLGEQCNRTTPWPRAAP